MTRTKMRLFSLALVGAFTVVVGTALAASYALVGDAMYVSPGNNMSPRAVQIRSDANPGFGGISYEVPAGTTFGELDVLSTDFRPEADDQCIGGAPRFSIGIDTDNDGDTDGFIFAYFGTDSAGAPCVPGVWQNTGDFLETNRLLDTSQLPGGTFYDPYALALTKYGGMTVTSIEVVVDASWAHADGEQTFLIDNTNVDGTIYTYDTPTNANECKNGGWMNLVDGNGKPFKSQGACIKYTQTGQ
jgi:hypothetical protein